MKFHGRIDNQGKRHLDKLELYNQRCDSLRGQEITIEIYRKKEKRSLNQNSTLHKWNSVLSDASGMDNSEMKRETKRRCNLGDWVNFGGRKKFNPWSSSRFTVDQCKLFMAEQEKIAIFLDVELPYT